MEITSERIKSRRLELGLTLEQVGHAVGVGKSTVRKWETGEIGNLRQGNIVKLAQALSLTPEYIMGWDKTDDKAREETIIEIEQELRRLGAIRDDGTIDTDRYAAIRKLLDVASDLIK